MPSQYLVTALVCIIAVVSLAPGCKRRSQTEATSPDDSGQPTVTAGTAPPPLATLTAEAARKRLLARGARVFTSDGQPDSPVRRVDLADKKFGNDDLKLLPPLTTLAHLDLSGSSVTDAGLIQLTKIEYLDRLDLSDTGITDTGLTHIAQCRSLSRLRLRGTRVTDAGMTHLTKLNQLNQIDVRNTKVTDAGLKLLKQYHEQNYSGLLQFVEDTRFATYRSPDGVFEVDFPWLHPKPQQSTLMTPFGAISDTTYMSGWKGWGMFVRVADLKAPGQPAVSAEQVVETARKQASQSAAQKVLQDQRRDLGDGIIVWDLAIWKPEKPLQGPSYLRFVAYGRWLFSLGIQIEGDTVPPEDRDRFLGSFKVLR